MPTSDPPDHQRRPETLRLAFDADSQRWRGRVTIPWSGQLEALGPPGPAGVATVVGDRARFSICYLTGRVDEVALPPVLNAVDAQVVEAMCGPDVVPPTEPAPDATWDLPVLPVGERVDATLRARLVEDIRWFPFEGEDLAFATLLAEHALVLTRLQARFPDWATTGQVLTAADAAAGALEHPPAADGDSGWIGLLWDPGETFRSWADALDTWADGPPEGTSHPIGPDPGPDRSRARDLARLLRTWEGPTLVEQAVATSGALLGATPGSGDRGGPRSAPRPDVRAPKPPEEVDAFRGANIGPRPQPRSPVAPGEIFEKHGALCFALDERWAGDLDLEADGEGRLTEIRRPDAAGTVHTTPDAGDTSEGERGTVESTTWLEVTIPAAADADPTTSRWLIAYRSPSDRQPLGCCHLRLVEGQVRGQMAVWTTAGPIGYVHLTGNPFLGVPAFDDAGGGALGLLQGAVDHARQAAALGQAVEEHWRRSALAWLRAGALFRAAWAWANSGADPVGDDNVAENALGALWTIGDAGVPVRGFGPTWPRTLHGASDGWTTSHGGEDHDG